jgi:hypothetical protein
MNKKLAIVSIAFICMLMVPEVYNNLAYAAPTFYCVELMQPQPMPLASILNCNFTKSNQNINKDNKPIPSLACAYYEPKPTRYFFDPSEWFKVSPPDRFDFDLTIQWVAGDPTSIMHYMRQGVWLETTNYYGNASHPGLYLRIKVGVSVGGVVIPTNKLVLLAPYIGLASIVAVGAVIAAKKYKRKE